MTLVELLKTLKPNTKITFIKLDAEKFMYEVEGQSIDPRGNRSYLIHKTQLTVEYVGLLEEKIANIAIDEIVHQTLQRIAIDDSHYTSKIEPPKFKQ